MATPLTMPDKPNNGYNTNKIISYLSLYGKAPATIWIYPLNHWFSKMWEENKREYNHIVQLLYAELVEFNYHVMQARRAYSHDTDDPQIEYQKAVLYLKNMKRIFMTIRNTDVLYVMAHTIFDTGYIRYYRDKFGNKYNLRDINNVYKFIDDAIEHLPNILFK